MMQRSTTCAGLAAIATMIAPVLAPAAWIVHEVPNPAHWIGDTEVTGINASGVICGMGNYVINTSSTPFRYDGTTVTELPLLPDADEPIALTTGINASGVVCGYCRNADGDSRAVYWVGTTLNPVPYPSDADTTRDLRAYGINDDGTIVGYYYNISGQKTAFYYREGVSHSLDAAIVSMGLTGGSQGASDVNNQGVICGSADDPGAVLTAYTYDIGSGTATLLGRIGFADNSGSYINEAGHVIGRGKYLDWDQYFRVPIHDGAWRFVGPEPENSQWPAGINNQDRVVGRSYLGGGDYGSWLSNGPDHLDLVWIELVGWSSVRVAAINDLDRMAGYGDAPAAGDATRGFILTPPPGDADHDGDLDLADHVALADCLDGPDNAATATCTATFDFDPADGDVDLADFAAFQRQFEGS